MSDKKFDDIIKNKLEGLKSEYNPSSWDQLSDKMNMDADSPAQEDLDFDQSIKNKVDHYEVESNPSSWEVLAAKMQIETIEEEVLDTHFDQTVQTKINNYILPFSDSSWDLLKSRMEKEAYLRTQLYVAKATEVFIILLLLFTVYRIIPENSFKVQKQPVEFAENPASYQKDFAQTEQINESPALIPELIPGSKKTNSENIIATTSEDEALLITQSDSKLITPPSFNGQEVNSSAIESRKIAIVAPINVLESQSRLDIPQQASLFVDQSLHGNQGNVELLVALQTVENLPAEGIHYDIVQNKKDWFVPSLNNRNTTKIWLNGFVSIEGMLINTPYDPVFKLPEFRKAAAGYSGGVSVSVQKKSVELDIGVSFASKGYQPQIIKEINGSLSTNYVERALTEIIFDMAQVNFNIKNHFFKNKKLQLYVMAGSTFNLITHSKYKVEEKSLTGIPFPSQTPVESKLLEQKEFEEGALDGGDLIQNSYLTLNFGLGLQHSFSKKFGVFFQPSYQRHILDGGIGPNKDRIHNLSLQVGTKFLLN